MSTLLYERPARIPTYSAVYRLAARPYALSSAFGAAGRTQYATLHHAATATKWVKIRSVEVALESSSAAAIVTADLARITTAPATGNPAITPVRTDPRDAAAEATALALPTSQATESDIINSLEWNLGITGAAPTTNPPAPLTYVSLYSFAPDTEQKPVLIRPGTLEGIAVTIDASAATTVKAVVIVTFTEEAGNHAWQ